MTAQRHPFSLPRTFWRRLTSPACLLIALLATAASSTFADQNTPTRLPRPRITVTALPGPTTIIRQTPTGPERLVYVEISNPTGNNLEHLALRYRSKDEPTVRDIFPVPPGHACDTLWVQPPHSHRLDAELIQQPGKDAAPPRTLWKGRLTLGPLREPNLVTIPASDPVTAADLKPLTLRGVNYYPRHHPWGGLWRHTARTDFDREFTEIAALHVNAIRTFYIFDPGARLHTPDGLFQTTLIHRVNTLLDVAHQHHIKVMFCITGGGGNPYDDFTFWKRYVRSGLEPFAYDGRVLMWDLINEPGGNKGPKATPQLARWIKTIYPAAKSYAPRHLFTVGLCWQFDQLWDLKVYPDVPQFHCYSGTIGVLQPGQPYQRNVADDLRDIIRKFTHDRPLIIGEFGYGSCPLTDPNLVARYGSGSDASEQRQLEIYRGVLQGSQAVPIAGVFNWTAFHFVPDWMNPYEQSFGIINTEGSLKPAGQLLQQTYQRWGQQHPAPWDQSPNP